MADPRKRLPRNAAGEFYVDSTCINCDTCRQLAPDTFAEADDCSYVRAQPAGADRRRAALRALVACPTASIGASDQKGVREAAGDFPLPVAEDVYYCGFTSPESFGGSSYFIRRPGGNWLVDAPRWAGRLAERLEAWGGVQNIFLTHRDDVADAERYARRFGSRRAIHRFELAAQPEAELVLDTMDPVELGPDLIAIPTPGHTRGHSALLYRERFLFSGDHLWWSRARGRLHASPSVCWHSWPQQLASLRKLLEFRFEWVLPGHGERVRLPPEEMRRQIDELLR